MKTTSSMFTSLFSKGDLHKNTKKEPIMDDLYDKIDTSLFSVDFDNFLIGQQMVDSANLSSFKVHCGNDASSKYTISQQQQQQRKKSSGIVNNKNSDKQACVFPVHMKLKKECTMRSVSYIGTQVYLLTDMILFTKPLDSNRVVLLYPPIAIEHVYVKKIDATDNHYMSLKYEGFLLQCQFEVKSDLPKWAQLVEKSGGWARTFGNSISLLKPINSTADIKQFDLSPQVEPFVGSLLSVARPSTTSKGSMYIANALLSESSTSTLSLSTPPATTSIQNAGRITTSTGSSNSNSHNNTSNADNANRLSSLGKSQSNELRVGMNILKSSPSSDNLMVNSTIHSQPISLSSNTTSSSNLLKVDHHSNSPVADVIKKATPLSSLIQQLKRNKYSKVMMVTENQEECLVYNQNDYSHQRIQDDSSINVISGTISKLIELAVCELDPGPGYTSVLLMAYKKFVSPNNLLKQLIKRYNCLPSSVFPNDLDFYVKYKTIIQSKVVQCIMQWINEQFIDFHRDPVLLARLLKFIHHIGSNGNTASKRLISTTFSKKRIYYQAYSKAWSFYFPPSLVIDDNTQHNNSNNDKEHRDNRPKDKEKFNLMNYSAEEIAAQLTLYNYRLLARIDSSQYMSQALGEKSNLKDASFSKVPLDQKFLRSQSPDLSLLIYRYNIESYWVATMILSVPTQNDQKSIIEKVISIAVICSKLHNYFSLYSLFGGLQLICIRNLQAWTLVSAKYNALFLAFKGGVASISSNYKNYRNEIKAVIEQRVPHIPCIPIIRRDLIYYNDGNDNFLDKTRLINVDKLKHLYKIITSLVENAKIQYHLEPNSKILSHLRIEMEAITNEDTLFKLSRASFA